MISVWKPTFCKGVSVAAFVSVIVLSGVVAGSAFGAATPVWRVSSAANTTRAPGDPMNYMVNLKNVGDADTSGSFTFTAVMPAGIEVSGVTSISLLGSLDCSATPLPASTVACTDAGNVIPTAAHLPAANFGALRLETVDTGAPLGVGTASFAVSGGGAAHEASAKDPTTVTSEPPSFGIDAFDTQTDGDPTGCLDQSNCPFTQAAGHPYDFTTSIDFNTTTSPLPMVGDLAPVKPVKDVIVDLPAGFVGNPGAVTQCSSADLAHVGGSFAPLPLCPASSQVGTTTVRLNELSGVAMGPLPVFNLVPPPDSPARFGFNVLGTVVTFDARVRSDSDYGISVDAKNVPEGLGIQGTSVTFWGVPAAASHDNERACPGSEPPIFAGGPVCKAGVAPTAFLRNPTSCVDPANPGAEGLLTGVHIDSWSDPAPGIPGTSGFVAGGGFGASQWKSGSSLSHLPPGYPLTPGEQGAPVLPTGCGKVPFAPSFSAQPVSPANAGQPSGFAFDLNVPQSTDPSAIGEADLKKAVVTLPAGVRVNPASADGLGACTPAQIGLHSTAAPSCPDSSKLGTLTVETPLLAKPLSGSVFLASPHDNPFGSLIAVYLVAQGSGVVIKQPGEVRLDPVTGQVTTIVDDSPQLPFSKLHIELKSGPRAALVLPDQCGEQKTVSALSSWSEPEASVGSNSAFTLTGCTPAQFAPSLVAGTVNPVAGSFSPFTLQLARTDRDSELASIPSLTLPPGLLADVASVPTRCTDAQATAAACPAASHVGEVTVGAGAGSSPYYVSGDVFLTGPYEGDPFGLAVVVHAAAGPFDLGYVVVRTAVHVNDDGSVTTRTDRFPRILQGIPLQVRDIRINLDRSHFILNPTSCAAMSTNGTVNATDGRSAGVNSRFQLAECSRLAFKPGFTVSTGSLTGRNIGASLTVKIASGKGQANIHGVHVTLPKALPSRNSTLQQACPASVFNQNPASCPQGSLVGTARANTPILAVPLTGPAYLVSHGGAAFPDLVLVLQGEGIVLHVVGHTNIKNGVTTSTFNTVPDAPITSFELKLPTGLHSALAAPGGHLCNQSLTMPTTLTGQNGAVVKKTTKIGVTGCPRHKHKKAKGAKSARASGGGR